MLEDDPLSLTEEEILIGYNFKVPMSGHLDKRKKEKPSTKKKSISNPSEAGSPKITKKRKSISSDSKKKTGVGTNKKKVNTSSKGKGSSGPSESSSSSAAPRKKNKVESFSDQGAVLSQPFPINDPPLPPAAQKQGDQRYQLNAMQLQEQQPFRQQSAQRHFQPLTPGYHQLPFATQQHFSQSNQQQFSSLQQQQQQQQQQHHHQQQQQQQQHHHQQQQRQQQQQQQQQQQLAQMQFNMPQQHFTLPTANQVPYLLQQPQSAFQSHQQQLNPFQMVRRHSNTSTNTNPKNSGNSNGLGKR